LTEEDGSPKPRDLDPSPEAGERFLRFEQALEPRLGPDGELGHVADWGAKLAGLVARVAGLFHTVEHAAAGRTPWDHDIEPATIEAAIALAERFLVPHALTAFGEMGADPALEEARVVLRAVERWGEPEFSRRDLHQRSLKRRFERPDDLDRPLAILVAHGYVRPLPSPERAGPGRRPSDRYEVNPLWRPRNPRNPRNAPGSARFEDSGDFADGDWGGQAAPDEEAAP
ncbi:MAG: YfjI family protein, partial [Chloroflexota bacterium]|nr:YfjI family protein [Chloroflexota bacterium]